MCSARTIDYDLTYLTHRLRLSLPPSDLLHSFLVRYFTPYFGFQAPGPAAAFATLEVRIGPPPADAPAFTGGTEIDIDRSKGFLACRGRIIDRGAERWVLLLPFQVVARIRRHDRHVALWGRTDATLRVPTLRLIEDLTADAVERGGGVFLHASAVVIAGRAVLALGNKRAGKTSFLCRMLHSFVADKLANDNCCLSLGEDGVTATGWPGFFKVEVATVAATDELAADFPPASRPLLDDNAALWSQYDKIALFPGQGAERFGAALVAAAPLGTLVLPRFGRDRPPGLTATPLAEVAGEIAAFLQGSRNPNHPPWMGTEAADGHLEQSLARILAAAGPALPVYRLHWAPALDDLLAEIPEVRPARRTLQRCRTATGTADDWPPLPDPARPDAVTAPSPPRERTRA